MWNFLGTESTEHSHGYNISYLEDICKCLFLPPVVHVQNGTTVLLGSLKLAVFWKGREESSQASKKFVCSITYQDNVPVEWQGSQQPWALSITNLYCIVNNRHITASNPSGAFRLVKKKFRFQKDEPVGYHMGWTMWLCIQPCAASSRHYVESNKFSFIPLSTCQFSERPSFLPLSD